jgi:N-acetyl-gamma-glutamylphosphate reductase
MYTVVKQNDKQQYGIMQYIVDNESEISTVPTTASPGSECLVIDTSTVYTLNHKKQWIKTYFKGKSTSENNNSTSTTSPTLNFVD